MKKKFFIVAVKPAAKVDDPSAFRFIESIDGTVTEARDLIKSDAYDEGAYLVLEDTSGTVTKSVQTIEKVSVTFEPSRKKPRKEKAAK